MADNCHNALQVESQSGLDLKKCREQGATEDSDRTLQYKRSPWEVTEDREGGGTWGKAKRADGCVIAGGGL